MSKLVHLPIRYSFLAFLVVLLPLSGWSQENGQRWSVTVGYGAKPSPVLFNHFMAFGSMDYETTRVLGPVQVGISYEVSKKIDLGLVYSRGILEEEGRYRSSSQTLVPTDDQVVSRTREVHTTFMPFCRIRWSRTPKMEVYSGYAQGWGRNRAEEWTSGSGHETDTYKSLAFQVTAVGIRYGKRVAGFAELGIGFHGLVNGGVTVRL